MKSHAWTAIFLTFILMQINKQREIAACGKLQHILFSHIRNGYDTHRWPWHAAIYHQNETHSMYQCGGTLVSSTFILTAAHCVVISAERVSVSLGRLHLNASHSSAPFIKVVEILSHPEYNPENNENDIAIIVLSTGVIFNNYVQPICMWNSDKKDLSEVIGKFGTVVGWGVTENGETSNVLQEASLPVVSLSTCLKSNRDLYGRFLTDTNFCAGTRNGTSVCTGDSGGSMTFQENGRFYIRGIVSVGAKKLNQSTNKFTCDSMQYAIFTDVAQYLPWITETIGCESVVQCVRKMETTTCELTVGDSNQKCEIILDETSGLAVTELEVFGQRSTFVPDLSSVANKFTNLEKLVLVNFKLKVVGRANLSPFRNILNLSFLANQITQFDDGALDDLKNLEVVQFSVNKLNFLPADLFKELNNLKILLLGHNTLTTLPAGIFRNNEKISELNLQFNQLNQLHPDVFEKLRNVETLWLSNNKLETLPANIFRNNEKVIGLDLRSNRLKEVQDDLLNGLTNLEWLYLGINQIESIPPGLFRSNSKLTKVQLSNNKIKKIEIDLNTMSQLILLDLKVNPCINESFDFPTWSLSEADVEIRRSCTN